MRGNYGDSVFGRIAANRSQLKIRAMFGLGFVPGSETDTRELSYGPIRDWLQQSFWYNSARSKAWSSTIGVS
jgi:hypothetical protein